MADTEPLIEVRDLHVSFHTEDGLVRAVDGITFSVRAGEVLGIVGESGSGKSVTALSIMRLIRDPNADFDGQVLYRGQDLFALSPKRMREVRGSDIAMVFQDPMTSLTPVYRVGWQIAEQIRAHEKISKRNARKRAIELLKAVGIPRAEMRVDDYPHQFSGGMRQRVMIAMALSCNPSVLIADEPTTALDVTIQAQILELVLQLREERGSAVVIITHDMGVVADVADRVLVMYARQGRRGQPEARAVRQCPAPLHLGADGLDPAARPPEAAAVDDDPGPPAVTARPAARLRFRAALCARPRGLRASGPARGEGAAGPPRPLHPAGGPQDRAARAHDPPRAGLVTGTLLEPHEPAKE